VLPLALPSALLFGGEPVTAASAPPLQRLLHRLEVALPQQLSRPGQLLEAIERLRGDVSELVNSLHRELRTQFGDRWQDADLAASVCAQHGLASCPAAAHATASNGAVHKIALLNSLLAKHRSEESDDGQICHRCCRCCTCRTNMIAGDYGSREREWMERWGAALTSKINELKALLEIQRWTALREIAT
jgi:hypothetical protein